MPEAAGLFVGRGRVVNMMVGVFYLAVYDRLRRMSFVYSRVGGHDGNDAEGGKDKPCLLQRKICNLHIQLQFVSRS
jgi:hypothetical protein